MDVTPQLLHDVECGLAKRGGYNTQDVDDFLERLAVGLERQEAQLQEARQRLDAAEARAAEAERRAAEAEQRASSTGDADETLKRTLVLAQRTADAAIREAREEAARTLASAQEQSERMLADARAAVARAEAEAEQAARAAHERTREEVLAEMAELEAARDRLRGDVEALDAYLASQRDRIRSTVDQLQALLEDPGALAATSAPALSDTSLAELAPDAVPADRPPLVADPDPELHLEAEEQAPWDDTHWDEAEAYEPAPAEDPGPATQPVDVLADEAEDEDEYLRELRKAMTDESPLGPRDEDEGAAEPPRQRFGRRR